MIYDIARTLLQVTSQVEHSSQGPKSQMLMGDKDNDVPAPPLTWSSKFDTYGNKTCTKTAEHVGLRLSEFPYIENLQTELRSEINNPTQPVTSRSQ